jgi:hypothetical protein
MTDDGERIDFDVITRSLVSERRTVFQYYRSFEML